MRAAKAGPDYIDPAFHAAATGCAERQSRFLGDVARRCSTPWPRRPRTGADIFVIEGVMGLFDGTNGAAGQRGATADLAAHFKLPVLLVLDVSRQAQSAAAVVRGFAAHDPAVRIAGVILNRVASERHRAVVADAIAALGVPILGAVPREAALALPERHLGLVQAGEHPDLTALIERLAAMAERHLDLDAIVASAAPLTIDSRDSVTPPSRRPGSASRWRTIGHSASSIRMSSRRGATPAPRSCRSRRSPTNRRRKAPTAAGCRAAIRSCMRKRSPRRGASATGCGASRKRGRCTASAAVTWFWVKAWRMRQGASTR